MRRIDREFVSQEDFIEIFKQGKVVQLAFVDGNEPYIVTLNYGFQWTGDKPTLYFHSAPEGRKITCIKQNPRVCFSISLCDPFVKGEQACNYGMKYRSIVGWGTMKIVEEEAQRIAGLNILMQQYTGKTDWNYDSDVLKKTMVTRLDVERITGKRKK